MPLIGKLPKAPLCMTLFPMPLEIGGFNEKLGFWKAVWLT